jgi:PiT family inorganic phosphate transporter
VDAQLVVAVLLATGFAVTNGLHDASNAIATLVATRAATPLQAILLASVFNLLGPLFSAAQSRTRSAASSLSRRA